MLFGEAVSQLASLLVSRDIDEAGNDACWLAGLVQLLFSATMDG